MHKITSNNIQSLIKMKTVPKSDLHNHAGYGGNVNHLSKYFHAHIESPQTSFHNLQDMHEWYENNINNNCKGMKGYIRRIQSAFMQATEDTITLLSLSFNKTEIDSLHGIHPFITFIDGLHNRFAPKTKFLPELSLRRETDTDEIIPWIEEILESGWFKSIDISGDEKKQPIGNFKKIYRIAEKHHLKLKAHVGEFGGADDIREAVEVLHLSEVHHGIAAAESITTMEWLAKEGIQLNICPTSNIMLSRIKNYESHPIRIFFDYGIPITINTDDMLIFNSSISQEYMKLFQHGLFNAKELEKIRVYGINQTI